MNHLEKITKALLCIKESLKKMGSESVQSIELLKHSGGENKEAKVLQHDIKVNRLAHECHDEISRQIDVLNHVRDTHVKEDCYYLADEDPTQWGWKE